MVHTRGGGERGGRRERGEGRDQVWRDGRSRWRTPKRDGQLDADVPGEGRKGRIDGKSQKRA